MGKVIDFSSLRQQLHGGGEPPDNRDMDVRIAHLERLAEKTGERLAALEVQITRVDTRVEEGFKRLASKADVAEAKNQIIIWVVSALFLAQLLPGLLKRLGL